MNGRGLEFRMIAIRFHY